jgi:hypothetical protein
MSPGTVVVRSTDTVVEILVFSGPSREKADVTIEMAPSDALVLGQEILTKSFQTARKVGEA